MLCIRLLVKTTKILTPFQYFLALKYFLVFPTSPDLMKTTKSGTPHKLQFTLGSRLKIKKEQMAIYFAKCSAHRVELTIRTLPTVFCT